MLAVFATKRTIIKVKRFGFETIMTDKLNKLQNRDRWIYICVHSFADISELHKIL